MDNSRPMNVHINPNLILSSGRLHVNKNKFNVPTTKFNPSSNTSSSSSENKIHYNPKFLSKSNIQPQEIKPKIYVNPSFSNKLNYNNMALLHDAQAYVNVKLSQSPVKSFNQAYNCLQLTSLPEQQSEDFTPHGDKILINPNFVNNFTQLKVAEPCSNYSDFMTSSEEMVEQVTKGNIPEDRTVINTKYCKINSQNSKVPSDSYKISKYKIRRSSSKSHTIKPSQKYLPSRNLQISPRKPRLSSSFKKIGSRKLVRKSLIQTYINARRQTLPYMMQHSKNTIASRKKYGRKIMKSKYKFTKNLSSNEDTVPPSYKLKKSNLPPVSKLKWRRTDSKSQDFVKIGKRKIVRKSVLQSLIEARRNKLYSPGKYSSNKKLHAPIHKFSGERKPMKSRFKVVRTLSGSSQNIPSSKLKWTSPNLSKKKDTFKFVNLFSTSKSVFFRMAPSLRMKLRLEEKRKRQMLLKKVNNRKKCLFYNRFGHCKGLENGSCSKLHDPKSVSVCCKFLKGLCNGLKCKLSHEVLPEKMPVCHQFLAGVCVRPSCPFLHVKLSAMQPICSDFLQGFCQLGDLCPKKHQFICPHWNELGKCSVKKCPYPHPQPTSENKCKPTYQKKDPSSKEPVENTSILKGDSLPEETANRYFSSDVENDKSKVSKKRNSVKPVDRTSDAKDGVNSVYNNESLLAFIPFS